MPSIDSIFDDDTNNLKNLKYSIYDTKLKPLGKGFNLSDPLHSKPKHHSSEKTKVHSSDFRPKHYSSMRVPKNFSNDFRSDLDQKEESFAMIELDTDLLLNLTDHERKIQSTPNVKNSIIDLFNESNIEESTESSSMSSFNELTTSNKSVEYLKQELERVFNHLSIKSSLDKKVANSYKCMKDGIKFIVKVVSLKNLMI